MMRYTRRLNDFIQPSRKRKKELTDMAERLFTAQKDAELAAFRARLEEAERLLRKAKPLEPRIRAEIEHFLEEKK